MPSRPRRAWPALLALALCLLCTRAPAAEQYRIGVLASRSKDICAREWSETAAYLSRAVTGASFEILPLTYDEIDGAVAAKKVDFLISNPVVCIELSQFSDVERLATLKRLHAGKAVTSYGGVIFTRADAEEIRSLADLRGKSFIAVAQNSFGGWLMAQRELREAAIDPHADFTRLQYGGSQDAVVRSVQSGRAAAGTVQSGAFERMAAEGAISLGDFKILNTERYGGSGYPFARSTRLYPEWTFAKLEHTDEDAAEKVSLALLGMPHSSAAARSANCSGWTYPVSNKAVYDCLSAVQYGPFTGSGILALRELRKQYGKPLATTFAGIALLFLFAIYASIINRRLQRSHRKMLAEVSGQEATAALLRESQQRAEQLLKIVPSAVMTVDIGRHITGWNDQAAAITGYSPREAIGRDCHLFMEQPCKVHCRVFDDMVDKPIIARECTIRHRDGRICIIEKNADVIRDKHGRVIGAVESFKDITLRKNAEQAILREKELAQQYLDIAGVVILVVDTGQNVRLINRKGCVILGRSADEVMGKNWFDLSLPPGLAARNKELFRDMVAGRREMQPYFEGSVLTRSGEQRLIAWHNTVIRDDQGAVMCTLSSGEDITERHLAEEALRESELKFRALSDSAADAILMMDGGGAITLWNSGAEKMFGWPAREAMGRDLHGLLAPEQYHERCRKALPAFRETGLGSAVGKTMELLGRHRCGDEIPVELSLSAISLKNSWYAVGILRDISRRRQTEQALREAMRSAEEANAAKSRFMANMSHEIRTPMNGVIGMTGLLLATDLTREQREYAESVRSSADSLLGIVNDILDFSKIEAGKMDIESIDFDLRSMLESLADMMAIRAREKGLEYAWIARAEAPSLVRGDPGRLRQVLANLVGNAVKFTDEGSVSLVVSLEQDDGPGARLRFEVSDTGIGLPESKVGGLFQPFVQADPSTTRKYGGSGLGLSICRQLVTLMGGEIGVRSAPGQGSTFWFTVQLERQAGAQAAAPAPMAGVAGARILVVDENEINRQMLASYLKAWNCRFEETSSGGSALELLQGAAAAPDPFTVAIIDLHLADIGAELIALLIKEDPALRHCALIVMSSTAVSRGDSRRLKKAGFAGYLQKPVKRAHLSGCLAAVLGIQQNPAGDAAGEHLVTSHALDGPGLSTARILVAEDNVTNQKVAVGILKNLGYRADTVANGLEAVSSISRIPYDLIFMDVQMPVMDGLEATRSIRGMEAGKHIPIIAMTAGALPQDREACLGAGMNDHLAKPIQPLEMAEKISRWLPAGAGRPHDPVDAPAQDGSAVFDAEDFIRRLMGDTSLVHSILSGFIKSLPQYLGNVREALAARDGAVLRRAAHTLKGSAANVGANALSAVALQIESCGASGDFPGAAERMGPLEQQAALFVEIASPLCSAIAGERN